MSISAGVSVFQLNQSLSNFNYCNGCGWDELEKFKSLNSVGTSFSFQQAIMPNKRISILFSEKIIFSTAGCNFISNYRHRTYPVGSVIKGESWYHNGTINYRVISFSPGAGARISFLHHRFNFHTILQPEIRLVNLSTSDYITEHKKSESDSTWKIWTVTEVIITNHTEKQSMSLLWMNVVSGFGYKFHTKNEKEIFIELNALKGISRLTTNDEDLLIYRSAIELMIGLTF